MRLATLVELRSGRRRTEEACAYALGGVQEGWEIDMCPSITAGAVLERLVDHLYNTR